MGFPKSIKQFPPAISQNPLTASMAYGSRKRGFRQRRRRARGKGVFRRRSSRALVRRAKNKALRRTIKRQILSTTETKYKSRTLTNTAQYYHNQLHKTTIWDTSQYGLFPQQGSSDAEREGDEIYTQGIMVRGMMACHANYPNTKVKFYYVPCNSVQGTPDNAADLLHAVTGNNWIDPIQQKRWPGLRYLGKRNFSYMNTKQEGGWEVGQVGRVIPFKFWIPMKRRLKFIKDNEQIPANLPEQGYIVALAYSDISTSNLNIIVDNIEMVATLYYKDP